MTRTRIRNVHDIYIHVSAMLMAFSKESIVIASVSPNNYTGSTISNRNSNVFYKY